LFPGCSIGGFLQNIKAKLLSALSKDKKQAVQNPSPITCVPIRIAKHDNSSIGKDLAFISRLRQIQRSLV
jgi:hypothetical protein